MGTECRTDSSNMATGSFYFFGVLFSIIIWIKCTDICGRKPIVATGATLQLLGYTGAMLYPGGNWYMYSYYFLLGSGAVMSLCTSYNYLIEFTPNSSKIPIGTLYLALQMLPALVLPIYLGIFSQNSLYFLYCGLGMTALGYLLLMTLPESPKYLYSVDRFFECEKALNKIAKINGV